MNPTDARNPGASKLYYDKNSDWENLKSEYFIEGFSHDTAMRDVVFSKSRINLPAQ